MGLIIERTRQNTFKNTINGTVLYLNAGVYKFVNELFYIVEPSGARYDGVALSDISVLDTFGGSTTPETFGGFDDLDNRLKSLGYLSGSVLPEKPKTLYLRVTGDPLTWSVIKNDTGVEGWDLQQINSSSLFLVCPLIVNAKDTIITYSGDYNISIGDNPRMNPNIDVSYPINGVFLNFWLQNGTGYSSVFYGSIIKVEVIQ
jgi:hypothetical protein